MKTNKNKRNFWIDALAFLIFIICTISGYAIMGGEHIRSNENGTETELMNADVFWGIALSIWAHLHLLTGWIVVALVMVHMITHRRWISIMISKYIRPGG
jgi:hypothetical protein